jgi:hypothetical protein
MMVAGLRLASIDAVLNAKSVRTPILDVFVGSGF